MAEHGLDDPAEAGAHIAGDAFAVRVVSDGIKPMGVSAGPVKEVDDLKAHAVRRYQNPVLCLAVIGSALAVRPGHSRLEAASGAVGGAQAAESEGMAGAGVCGPGVMYVRMGPGLPRSATRF